MVSIHNEKVDIREPLAQVKYLNIQSLRYVSSEIRNLKESINSKVYLGISMVFAIFIAIFAQTLNWLMVLVFIDLFLAVLVFFAKIFYTQRREHAKVSRNIIKELNRLGMNIKE